MVHVLGFTETRPPLPDCAQLLTNVGDNLLHDGILDIIVHNMSRTKHLLHAGLWHHYLELLVWGAATGTAGALDSDGGLPLCVTHFQKRCVHAPPEHTHMHAHKCAQRILNAHCITLVYQDNNADCWTVTGLHRLVQPRPWCLIGHIFSCHDSERPNWPPLELSVRRGQTGACSIWAQLRIFIPSRPGQLNVCQVTLDWATISLSFAYMGTLCFTAISQLSSTEGCHIPSTSLARAAWRCCLWVRQLFQTLALRSQEERNSSGGYLQTSQWYPKWARGWDWYGEWLT